jgi:membrane protein YdbS with pleckstrin-like domain
MSGRAETGRPGVGVDSAYGRVGEGCQVAETATGSGPAAGRLELRPPRHRVSRRAVWFWTVRALPGWLLLVAAQVLWWLVDGGGSWHALLLGASVLLGGAHLVVMPRWRYAVHRWEVAPHAVYTQSGWFTQERRIAPISRIQTVDSERGPLEQLFRLANVTVTTASASGPLRIHGLDRDTAQRLVEELTDHTRAGLDDAT